MRQREKRKTGIVGFGVVGKSVLRFLSSADAGGPEGPRSVQRSFFIWDRQFTKTLSLQEFFEFVDEAIVSPGIDLRGFEKYKEKILCELDLFSKFFNKKTIGITGSLGKTTVTRILNKILPFKSEFGGNIGFPMLDLIKKQKDLDFAVIEISSFQLEQSKVFAPEIAVFTNFYPNHIDRHCTIKNYFDAKWKLFEHQTKDKFGLFSVNLLIGKFGEFFKEKLKTYAGQPIFVHDRELDEKILSEKILDNKAVFFVEKEEFFKAKIKNNRIFEKTFIFNTRKLPKNSFLQNWLIALSVLEILEVKNKNIFLKDFALDSHRMELFSNIKNIDFYNDSKATVIQATIAAVEKLEKNKKPIILVLGGMSKGVDRSGLIDFLSKSKNMKKVFFLGKNNKEFLEYEHHTSLQDLVHAIMQTAVAGDQVLFSPSGASFDMFKNYEERGDAFKRVVCKNL